MFFFFIETIEMLCFPKQKARCGKDSGSTPMPCLDRDVPGPESDKADLETPAQCQGQQCGKSIAILGFHPEMIRMSVEGTVNSLKRESVFFMWTMAFTVCQFN